VAVVAVLAGLTVWMAPAERTLGTGIRAVYVHVALTVTGVLGFLAGAVLGVVALVSRLPVATRWLLPVGRVALGFFAAGTVTSMVAARVNWGGLFLDEPLMRSSLLVLLASIVVHTLMSWTRSQRLLGLLGIVPAAAISWALLATPAVLHPGAWVVPDSAAQIQWTFAALTVLCLAAGAGLVRQLGARPRHP